MSYVTKCVHWIIVNNPDSQKRDTTPVLVVFSLSYFYIYIYTYSITSLLLSLSPTYTLDIIHNAWDGKSSLSKEWITPINKQTNNRGREWPHINDAWSHKYHVLSWGCGHSEELDHTSHPSPAVEHPTLHPKISHKTNTNQQESHIKRGHPIVFGLILFFALIEGCITAWLGMSCPHPLINQSY